MLYYFCDLGTYLTGTVEILAPNLRGIADEEARANNTDLDAGHANTKS